MSDHKICHDCDNGFDTPLYTTDTCKDFVKIKCTTWSTDPISCLNIKTGDHGDIVIRKMADAICKLTNGQIGTPNLQAVTTVGNTTTLPIIANTFVTGNTIYGSNITNGNVVLTYPTTSGVIPTSVFVNGSSYSATSDGVINLGVLSTPTPNLQQVTNVGRDTTNPIQLIPNSGHGLEFGYISNTNKLFLGLGDLTEHQDLFFPDFTGVLATSVNNRLADGKGNVDLPISFIQNGLIEGGYVTWTGQGYTYEVSPALYVINGQTYRTTKPSFITLDPSDPTNSRIDILGVNDQGQVIKVTGVPSTDPIAAQIDYLHELSLTTILLLPNSSTPQIGEDIIYNENIEWVGTAIGVSANFNNLTNTFIGTKSIDVVAITDADYLKFLRSSSIAVADWDSVKFSIQLKSKLGRKTGISIAFYDNDSRVTNLVPLSLAFGLDVNNISTYQTIVVPFNSLTFSTTTFNSFRIIFRGNNTGVYVDNIRLQGGIVQPVPNNDDLILTTNGSSGPATLNNNILNIPNYNTGGGGGSAYILPIASDTVLGGVKVGNGLSIDATTGILSTVPVSAYTLPIASNTILGGIKIGTTLSIDVDGVVNVIPSASYTLPTASSTVLGGVKVGNNLSIDNNGVLSAIYTPIELTTNGSTGAATFINNILNIPTPTPYTLPTASTSVLGGVKVGTNLSIDGAGVLSASFTTPALQAVTDVGNSTTNNILINKNDGLFQVGSTTTDAIARIGADILQGGYLELGSLNTYRSFLYNNAGTTQNTVLKFPNYPSAIIPVSVNGQFADLSGNITLTIDSGTTPVRFGIEDNILNENRIVDIGNYPFNFRFDGESGNKYFIIDGYNGTPYVDLYLRDSTNNTLGELFVSESSAELNSDINTLSSRVRVAGGQANIGANGGLVLGNSNATFTPTLIDIRTQGNHDTNVGVLNYVSLFHNSTNDSGISIVATSSNGNTNISPIQKIEIDKYSTSFVSNTSTTTGNYLTQTLVSPSQKAGDYIIPLSVNGVVADSTGNITLDLGSGGGGTLSRFGIEDNLGIQDRNIDMQGQYLYLNNASEFYAGTPGRGIYVYNQGSQIGGTNSGLESHDLDTRFGGTKTSVQLSAVSSTFEEGHTFFVVEDQFRFRRIANILSTEDHNNNYVDITIPVIDTDRYMPLSVNGTFADSTGNITLDLGSGGGSTYTLPIATANVLGGIKVGSGLTIDSSTGILSAVSAANLTLTTTGNRGASTLSNSVLNIPNYTYTAGNNINITTGNVVECNVIDWAISNGATSEMTSQVDYTNFGSGYGRKIVRWNGLANNSPYFALPDAATTFVEIIGNNATIGGAYENFSYYNIGTGHGITNVNLAITSAGGFLFNKAITVVNSTGNDITLSFNNRLAPLTNKYDNPPSQMLTSTLTLPAGHTIKLVSTIAYNNNEPGSSNFLRWIPAGIYPSRTIGSSGSSYTLPTASNTVLGGVKVGTGLSIDGSGVLSATGSTTQTTSYQEVTATEGQTVFPFTGIPTTNSDFMIFVNGGFVLPRYYTFTTTDITFTTGQTGEDVVSFQRLK